MAIHELAVRRRRTRTGGAVTGVVAAGCTAGGCSVAGVSLAGVSVAGAPVVLLVAGPSVVESAVLGSSSAEVVTTHG